MIVSVEQPCGKEPDPETTDAVNYPENILNFPNDDTIYLPYTESRLISATVCTSDRKIKCRVICDEAHVPALIRRNFDLARPSFGGVEGCRFLPVTASVCQEWLGLELVSEQWESQRWDDHIRVLGPALMASGSQWGISDLPHGTIAAALDCSLSGQHHLDPVTMLDERAARMIELFDDLAAEARQKRNAGYDKLNARLRAMRGEEK
jgi:hypothetical protein